MDPSTTKKLLRFGEAQQLDKAVSNVDQVKWDSRGWLTSVAASASTPQFDDAGSNAGDRNPIAGLESRPIEPMTNEADLSLDDTHPGVAVGLDFQRACGPRRANRCGRFAFVHGRPFAQNGLK